MPMMEERVRPDASNMMQEPNRARRSSMQQSYSRERKPSANLPLHLQRQGNEITQQIYLDEVFAALKDVLNTLRRESEPGTS